MAERNQLAPGAAVVIGVFFGIIGTLVTLLALGTFGDGHLSDGTPPWVGIAVGVMFLLAGLAIIVGYGVAGGATDDGDLPPGTPRGVRLVQSALSLGITAARVDRDVGCVRLRIASLQRQRSGHQWFRE